MKVMIAVDDSCYAEQFVNDLTKRTWPKSTKFKLVTVIEPLHLSDSEQHKILAYNLDEKRKEAAKTLLKGMKKSLDKIPESVVHYELREGSVDRELVDVAVEWKPDRLMIGAVGKGNNKSHLGSTARSVVSHSPCTVEVVRNKDMVRV